jgi:hypothetical protein
MRFQPCEMKDIRVGAVLGWKAYVPTLGRPRKYKITSIKYLENGYFSMVLLRVDEADLQKGESFDFPTHPRNLSNCWYLMSSSYKEFTDEEYEALLV